MPAKTVMIIFPACVVVSAHGSEMDWNFAPVSRDLFHRVQQVAGGPGEAIQFPV
jgi:hypothetical protein